MKTRRIIPRGAKKLVRLVASDMASTDHPRYVMRLRQISESRTLHHEVRSAAARMVERACK
jgi:hypothetical protein